MVSKGRNLVPERGKERTASVSETGKSSNVKVVIRVRPFNAMESCGNNRSVVRAMDDRVVVFDPHEDFDATNFIPNKRPRRRSNILDRRVKDLRFIFDRVFDENASNRDIFDHTTKTIIDGVLNGYNCTVFAYGATGAGKTHTMLGNDKTPGVMFLTMMDLYKRIDEMKDERTCEVAVSYLEVNTKIQMNRPPLILTSASYFIEANLACFKSESPLSEVNSDSVLYDNLILPFGTTFIFLTFHRVFLTLL